MANPKGIGGFKVGFDPRRKILTREDRVRGYHNAPSKIRARIRGLYKGGRIKAKGETVYTQFNDVDF